MSVDGSFAAEAGARYALALAKACGAELDLLFVAGDQSTGAMKRAEESLLRLLRQAHGLGLTSRSVTEIGDPIRVMRDYVAREGITLAMASVTGPEVARRLLREVPCAMLLVRVVHPGRMASPHEILVPVYGGEFEGGGLEAAADLLANLGQFWHARVVLFRLRQPLTRLFDRPRFSEETPEQAERTLHPFIAALSRRGLARGRGSRGAVVTALASRLRPQPDATISSFWGRRGRRASCSGCVAGPLTMWCGRAHAI